MAKYLDKIGLSYFWSLIKSKLLPDGGQQGQVLAKASSADDDVVWATVDKSDTITGDPVAFNVVNTGMDATATSLPSSKSGSYYVLDDNGNVVGELSTTEGTNGTITTRIGSSRFASGDAVSNWFELQVGSDGTKSVAVSDRSKWRDALKFVATGDNDAAYFGTVDNQEKPNHLMILDCTINNHNTTYNGHRVQLIISADNWLTLYDWTTGLEIWSERVEPFRPGTILWSGAYQMTSGHRVNLSKAVSNCPSGIVLHWQAYDGSSVQDYDHVFTFIPKTQHSGKGVQVILSSASFANVGTKYIYVSDTYITGNNANNATGTASGITYKNNHWVLTQVIAA